MSIIPKHTIVTPGGVSYTLPGYTWSGRTPLEDTALAGCAVGKCKFVPTCEESGINCVLDDSDIDKVLEVDWVTNPTEDDEISQFGGEAYGLSRRGE